MIDLLGLVFTAMGFILVLVKIIDKKDNRR